MTDCSSQSIDQSESDLQLSAQQHLCLQVFGRVQGVGFRPFVYQQATDLSLKGSVCNTAQGLHIYVQGDLRALDSFQKHLLTHAPPQAVIQSIETQALPLADYQAFSIIQSQTDFEPSQLKHSCQIPPDISLCNHCLTEFNDPNNRRYSDPFINCSDCGPRYTIINRLPYDRQHSAMDTFEMCDLCLEEYQNPLNRRYHTQGICCPNCGPHIQLYDAAKNTLSEREAALKEVARLLKKGEIVAFKSIGGFHILCDATNETAVQKLRQRKRRSHKPFAVLCSNLDMAKQFSVLSPHEQALLKCDANPIVLVTKKETCALSDSVAPDSHRLGLFLAYSPLQHVLFKYCDRPLIATSANHSGEPIIYQQESIFTKLCRPGYELVDYVLDFDRAIVNPCDDSIVQSVDGKSAVTLRLARGLAPYYGHFSKEQTQYFKKMQLHPNKPIVAVGAQQKSSVAFSGKDHWMLSPYIGDLHHFSGQQRFDQTLQNLQTLTQTSFDVLACDAHPDYSSSQWAKKNSEQNTLPLVKVSHHYAHVLACLAEYQLTEPVIAFSWDGSGLGTDGSLWGGETLIASSNHFHRIMHLRPFKLLGGDLASQQPRRVALALLFDLMPLQHVLELDNPTVNAFSEFEIYQLYKLYENNLNSPETSSMGRLFDAVASLVECVQILDYEGQSGMRLEALYDESVVEAYEINAGDHYGTAYHQIELEPILWQIIKDQQSGRSNTDIVSRFFNMLVNLIDIVAGRFKTYPVVVTGGVFQNQTLLKLLCQRFEHKEQALYFQQKTPINDGSIALGQLWAALHR